MADVCLNVIDDEFDFKKPELRRKFADIILLYNILNNKIDCSETLGPILINDPAFSFWSTTTLFYIPIDRCTY